MIKKFSTVLVVSFIAILLSYSTVLAKNTPENITINVNKYEITPKADIIDWQYKVVNNILYKRLYNYTLNKPISDWIRVD